MLFVHRVRARTRLSLFAVAVATLAAGCSSSAGTVRDTTSTMNGSSTLSWETCGDADCAEITVPVLHGDPNAPTVALDVVRKAASRSDGARVLVLLPDRGSGAGVRPTVTSARLQLGSGADDFTVVSLGMRGGEGATLPTGWEAATGTLETVEDLEDLRRELGVDRVSVLGWGSGATVAAAWTMLYPGAIEAAVLDTPADPGRSMAHQGVEHLKALAAGVDAAWHWCASHIACPLNHEPTVSWQAVRHIRDIDSGPPELTDEAVARAAYAALSLGETRSFFAALRDVIDRMDTASLVALARLTPPASEMAWRCADVSHAASERILSTARSLRPRWFVAGDERRLHELCLSRTALGSPLGSVRAEAAAIGARVLVLAARFDPVWATVGGRTMAKRMSWKYASVPTTRHLVVGIDHAATARAMAFLAGR